MAENNLGHVRQVSVKQGGQFLCVQVFRNGSESANIAKEHGYFRFSGFNAFRIAQQTPNDLRTDILLKCAADFSFFLLFEKDAIERNQADVGDQREQRRNDEVQPPAVKERPVDNSPEGNEQEEAERHPARLHDGQPQT